ncbi:MAG: hypothetical protein QW423_00210 [Candidatus Aenigmatarchaeota archaeon]
MAQLLKRNGEYVAYPPNYVISGDFEEISKILEKVNLKSKSPMICLSIDEENKTGAIAYSPRFDHNSIAIENCLEEAEMVLIAAIDALKSGKKVQIEKYRYI